MLKVATRLSDACVALEHLVSWVEANEEASESLEMKERLRLLQQRIEHLAVDLQPVERQRRFRCEKRPYLRRVS